MAEKITDDVLGAWLLRCNPSGVWKLGEFVAAGGYEITNWSVVDNYRSRMMRPGQRVVFWVTGGSREFERGIWGIGHVTSEIQDSIPETLEAEEVSYWVDEAARLAVTNSIDVAIPLLLGNPTSDASLKAAGIDDLEVQRQPQGSNPSCISKDQMARLDALLPEWPEASETDAEQVRVSDRGAGFGDATTNKIVEAAAMAAVAEFYTSSGWDVDDVSMDKVGWDLTCTSPTGEVARVEVKGVRSDRPVVLLTANEVRSAKIDDGWVLAVVTRALSNPQVTEFEASAAIRAAKAYVYRAEFAT